MPKRKKAHEITRLPIERGQYGAGTRLECRCGAIVFVSQGGRLYWGEHPLCQVLYKAALAEKARLREQV